MEIEERAKIIVESLQRCTKYGIAGGRGICADCAYRQEKGCSYKLRGDAAELIAKLISERAVNNNGPR